MLSVSTLRGGSQRAQGYPWRQLRDIPHEGSGKGLDVLRLGEAFARLSRGEASAACPRLRGEKGSGSPPTSLRGDEPLLLGLGA